MHRGPQRVLKTSGPLLFLIMCAACASPPDSQSASADPGPETAAVDERLGGADPAPQAADSGLEAADPAIQPPPGAEPGPEAADPALQAPAGTGSGSTTKASPSPPPEGHAFVIFGADTVVAEVASTFSERAAGLMNRSDLPPNGGMLFMFETVQERSFWMKDTPLDLDVAFMEEGYVIFQIATMEANSLKLTDSEKPVFAALEVHGGWLASHGVEVGDQAEVVFRD